ncbi:C40 family peptidase [Streptomyces netropsis]|uniref:C40 family peptidase n=1 Tax=Streptomyces netropsis TaxID=55404 RepID=UPI0030D1C556
MRTPAFTDEIPDGPGCALCVDAAASTPTRAEESDPAHAPRAGPHAGCARHRCALRGAIVAAVGVAVIAGSGAGAAAAPEPADPVGGGSSVYEPGDPEDPALPGDPLADEPLPDEPGPQESGPQEPGPEGAIPEGSALEGVAPDGSTALEPPSELTAPLSDQDIPGAAVLRAPGEPVTPGPLAPPDPADPDRTPQAPAAKPKLESAVTFALAQTGDPYKLGGNGPRAWDCSGLIQQAYRRAGVKLPRIAADQYRATQRITRRDLRRGDLVFWSTNGKASGVHHVAIYLGGGKYLEAPRPGKKVRISTFSYYSPNLYGRPR